MSGLMVGQNCHNSWPDFATGACPMNFYRTGGDISANIGSIIGEVVHLRCPALNRYGRSTRRSMRLTCLRLDPCQAASLTQTVPRPARLTSDRGLQ